MEIDINERIKKIGKYFAVFNVNNGVACLGITLPDKWTLFDVKTICTEFKIQMQQKDSQVFFVCAITNGFSPIFDAVDFIIEQNLALEEKSSLLKEKAEELRDLFNKLTLAQLKTLTFVYNEGVTEEVEDIEKETIIPIDIKKEIQKKQDGEIEKPVEQPKPQKRGRRKNNENDSSLMSFVKENLENV